MRKGFYDIFVLHSDGSIEPRQPVRIGGIQFGPGVRFGSGISFGGIDLTKFVGRDFEVDEDNGVLKLKGVY